MNSRPLATGGMRGGKLLLFSLQAAAVVFLVAAIHHLSPILEMIRTDRSLSGRSLLDVDTSADAVFPEINSTVKPPLFRLSPGQKEVDPAEYNPFWLIVSKKRKLAITFVPKVMCSSLREAFDSLECPSPDTKCAEARRNSNLKRSMGVLLSNYTRAIFFRDPFERLYSAYSNSDKNEFIHLERCQNKTQCSLAHRVDEMATNPVAAFENEHFKPQKEIAQTDSMHYHYYLRLSSPNDQNFFWNVLMGAKPRVKNTSAKNPITSNTRTGKSETTVLEIFQKLPRSTLDKIATMYRDDLVLWKQLLDRGTPRMPGKEETVFDLQLVGDPDTKEPISKNKATDAVS